LKRFSIAGRRGGLDYMPDKRIHVCYALALDEDYTYAALLNISAACIKRLYQEATFTIVTDDESLPKTVEALRSLIDAGANVISVGEIRGGARLRSRFAKTQIRSAVHGGILFLDADTVAVREFYDLFDCSSALSAAIDRNCSLPQGGFPVWAVPEFDCLEWPHPTKLYLNTGVVFWRECSEARKLGQQWHESWLRYATTVDNPADQPAFNHSLDALDIEPKIMSDAFNARVGVSSRFASDARIYHLLSGCERANGTFIDRLLATYLDSGQVDFSLVEDAVQRGHPWIEV
jgi:hypothetical protein